MPDIFYTSQWAGMPLTLSLSLKGSSSYLTYGSLDPPESTFKQHLDWFSHFSTAHGYDEQTHTHTDHRTLATIGRI